MDFFKRYLLWLCSFAVAIILVVGYTIVFAPPQDFPSDSIVVIIRLDSASEISEQLSDAKGIKHPSIMNLILQIS